MRGGAGWPLPPGFHAELGIASRLDFSFSGPQAGRLARLVGLAGLRERHALRPAVVRGHARAVLPPRPAGERRATRPRGHWTQTRPPDAIDAAPAVAYLEMDGAVPMTREELTGKEPTCGQTCSTTAGRRPPVIICSSGDPIRRNRAQRRRGPVLGDGAGWRSDLEERADRGAPDRGGPRDHRGFGDKKRGYTGPRLPGDTGPHRPSEKKSLTHNPFAALASKLEGAGARSSPSKAGHSGTGTSSGSG